MRGSSFTPFERATKWSWLIWVRAASAGRSGSVGLLVLGLLRLRDLVVELMVQPELRESFQTETGLNIAKCNI